MHEKIVQDRSEESIQSESELPIAVNLSNAVVSGRKKHCGYSRSQAELFFRRAQRILNPINDSAIGLFIFPIIMGLIYYDKMILPLNLTLTIVPILASALNELYFTIKLRHSEFILGDNQYNHEAKLIKALERLLTEVPKCNYIKEIVEQLKGSRDKKVCKIIQDFKLVGRYIFIRQIANDMLNNIVFMYVLNYIILMGFYSAEDDDDEDSYTSRFIPCALGSVETICCYEDHFFFDGASRKYQCGNLKNILSYYCAIFLFYLLKLSIDIININWHKIYKKWRRLSSSSQNILVGIKLVISHIFKFMSLYSIYIILYIAAINFYIDGFYVKRLNHELGDGTFPPCDPDDSVIGNNCANIKPNNLVLFYSYSPFNQSGDFPLDFFILLMFSLPIGLLYLPAYCLPDYKTLLHLNYFRGIKKITQGLMQGIVASGMTYVILTTFYYAFLFITAPYDTINLEALQVVIALALIFSLFSGIVSVTNVVLNYTPPDPNKWNITSKKKEKELMSILNEKERLIGSINDNNNNNDNSEYGSIINESDSSGSISNETGFWSKLTNCFRFKPMADQAFMAHRM